MPLQPLRITVHLDNLHKACHQRDVMRIIGQFTAMVIRKNIMYGGRDNSGAEHAWPFPSRAAVARHGMTLIDTGKMIKSIKPEYQGNRVIVGPNARSPEGENYPAKLDTYSPWWFLNFPVPERTKLRELLVKFLQEKSRGRSANVDVEPGAGAGLFDGMNIFQAFVQGARSRIKAMKRKTVTKMLSGRLTHKGEWLTGKGFVKRFTLKSSSFRAQGERYGFLKRKRRW